ncbi:MAG TPA: hypothetical protein VF623_06340 [Segetibacter sp.]|jgi:hypothetical protein
MEKLVLFIIVLLTLGKAHAQKVIPLNPLEHVGDTVTISGRIYAGYYLVHVNTKPTFLNLFDSLPNHRLMLRIDSIDRGKFEVAPEKYFLNQKVSVTGVVANYKGTALIKISDPSMIVSNEKIEVIDTAFHQNTSVSNKPVSTIDSKFTDSSKLLPATPVADTILQTQWIDKVAGKSYPQTLTDVRIVDKEIPLRVNPASDAPVIAELQPGISISRLHKSKRWSYITVRKPDGTGGVYGFIKTRTYKKLKKAN